MKAKPKMIDDICVMVAGKAGDGVLFTGNVLSKILKREGWEVATYRDFPSNIRGEDTGYFVRASLKRKYGRSDKIDVLLAFDCDAIFEHINFMEEGGLILCEGSELETLKPSEKEGKIFHKFPMKALAQVHFNNQIYKNMIALGALCYILDLNFRVIEKIILESFLEKKGKEVVRKNIQAINIGCEQVKKIIEPQDRHKLVKRKDSNRILICGDEAIALGALAAGCRFFAAYPICPATEIWEMLAVQFPKFKGIVVQTEDELAAINMVLGASYAGARAMTSTSGPGASLMMEGFSLSGMAEIPAVIAHVQRVGPSTGIPTKSEQADLGQWIFGSHGDFPRIVIAPGTIEECFEFTIKAFNLAEKYQVPVILLTEQHYGQNYFTVENFDLSNIKIDRGKLLNQKELSDLEEYKRYRFTSDGVSPRALPSMKNGIHMVESNEHNENGYRDESEKNRNKMMRKRMAKLKGAARDAIPPKQWGDRNAQFGIIGYGSTYGPIKESLFQLKKLGITANYLQLRTLWPFPKRKVENYLEKHKAVFVVDNNFSGQLYSLIKSQVETAASLKGIRKYSSKAFIPSDITSQIQEAL
jgi:2-oxoglutarate ferredoxin oxidoreductase subunit alpha